MSYITQAQEGLAALSSSNWPVAISKLTSAISASPSANKPPLWLLGLSKAYVRSGDASAGLAAAESAYLSATARGDRGLMAEAQLRRAVALFKLGRFADADLCAAWSQELALGKLSKAAEQEPKLPAVVSGDEVPVDEQGRYTVTTEMLSALSKKYAGRAGIAAGGEQRNRAWDQAQQWRLQTIAALEKLPPGEDEKRSVTVKKVPDPPKQQEKLQTTSAVTSRQSSKQTGVAAAAKAESKPQASTRPEQYRLDWYQSDATVNVSIFIKKDDQQALMPQLGSDSIMLVWDTGSSAVGLLRLWAPIDPSKSTIRPSNMKVEFTLAKKTPGKWPVLRADHKGLQSDKVLQLEPPENVPDMPPRDAQASSDLDSEKATIPSQEPQKVDKGKDVEKVAAPTPAPPAVGTGVPAYPTSSKKGPKNWDKLKEVDEAEKEEEEAQDVDRFFQKLYKNATPEQQRAMMKSFIESNGTALSTDWNDVGKRTVPTHPPDGVEAKKWDS